MEITQASRAEEQVILQSIRDAVPIEAIEAALDNEIDWTWLIRHVLANKITPQLNQSLARY